MPSSEPVRFGRKRALPPCPNPLFLQWLTELRDEAKEKGLKIQYTYQKAINSLNKYPLPLQNAKEAKILQNFGDGICRILEEKLQRHFREKGPGPSEATRIQNSEPRGSQLDPPAGPIHRPSTAAPPPGPVERSNRLAPSKKKNGDEDEGRQRGGARRKREYVPQRRSGGHAVLLALYRQSQVLDGRSYMFKLELQAEAQPLCDKSFTVPDPGSKYTAWSSVSTLIQKNLVLKTHSPARYSLTEEGLALARRLAAVEHEEEVAAEPGGGGEDGRRRRERQELEDDCAGVVDLTESDEDDETAGCATQTEDVGSSSGGPQGSRTTSGNADRDVLAPGTYEILLCVDFIETTGGSQHRKQELVKELQRNGVRFDVRKLNVGDFLWVARENMAPVPGQLRAPAGRELVLDYIIERKRMDDLCGSIIDGRFREQKFRLKRCGLRKPIYLVEGGSTAASHLSLPEATLQQAIVNTQVVDGFFVKRVQDVRESAAYLTVMTRHLTKLYQNCTLSRRSREQEGDAASDEEATASCSLMSFAEFNHGAVKNKCQTVREVFARQLMQISGLSGDKAAAILQHYSTPYSLLSAYDRCSSEAEKEKLLSCIRYGKLQRSDPQEALLDKMSCRTPNESMTFSINQTQYTPNLNSLDLFLISLHGIVSIIGIVENLLILAVVGFYIRRSIISTWILNLAASDLLTSAFLPFFTLYMAQGNNWILGKTFCRIYSSIFFFNMHFSGFLLAAISLDRCLVVVRPVWAQNYRSIKGVKRICAGIWVLAIICIIPFFLFRDIIKVGDGRNLCYYNYALYPPSDLNDLQALCKQRKEILAFTKFLLAFLIPLLVIIFSYLAVNSILARRGCRRGPLRLVRLVTFFLCWAPYHLLIIMEVMAPNKHPVKKLTEKALPVAATIAFLNATLNPILYVFSCNDLRMKIRYSFGAVMERVRW
uniref:Crossover junction endonuclease MUS81 n=1 Tax=Oryzias latipes TaxID=8090 RepID=A0A3P9JGL4_ORYLA